MNDRLFDVEPPPRRRPALMLSWPPIGVPDSLHSVGRVRAFPSLQRAVAEHIAFGAWCDALAWCDVVRPTRVERAVEEPVLDVVVDPYEDTLPL